MRPRQPVPPRRRRSAAEWSRLVADLHQSGQSPEEFSASRDVPLARLRWWKWSLGKQPSPAAETEEMRLVPVVVEPVSMTPPTKLSAPSAPAWELCTAGGDVLRVYRATPPAEIQVVLAALVRRGGRR